MKVTINLLLCMSLLLFSCKKNDTEKKEEYIDLEIPEIKTKLAFYASDKILYAYIPHVQLENRREQSLYNKPSCDLDGFGSYFLSEGDLQQEELLVTLEYEYVVYPNIIKKKPTFKIPANKIKKGACTPVEIQEKSLGDLSLYIHER